ncbi:21292_t:CDS:10 [Entrophospora sp. SA101]|nr:21292_t:CDS:10 [Entrophospora sp. SA101]
MKFIKKYQTSKDGLSYMLSTPSKLRNKENSDENNGEIVNLHNDGIWEKAEKVLITKPEIIEIYEKLNSITTNPNNKTKKKSLLMPNTCQNMIDNCLQENHYSGAIDLIGSFYNQSYNPSEKHIRQLMDLVVNDQKVNYRMALKAHKILNQILQQEGSLPFENIWSSSPSSSDFDSQINEIDDIWKEYKDFWNFFKKTMFQPHLMDDDKSQRKLLLFEHIVSVLEVDIKLKQENLSSTIFLQLIPNNYGAQQRTTNIKTPVDILISIFDKDEISKDFVNMIQRLLDLMIILSYSEHICSKTLTTEIYLKSKHLDSSKFQLFLQTLISNTFKAKLLDLALSNADINSAGRNYRHLIKSQLSLSKIINVYFDSIPFKKTKKGDIMSDLAWRHYYMLYWILQSYISSKIIRVNNCINNNRNTRRNSGDDSIMMICGLDDEEYELVINNTVVNKINNLQESIKKNNIISSGIKFQVQFLLEMLSLNIESLKLLCKRGKHDKKDGNILIQQHPTDELEDITDNDNDDDDPTANVSEIEEDWEELVEQLEQILFG